MGLKIDREVFEESEYGRFSQRLGECLEALELLLRRPDFGTGPASIGAELELFLIDAEGRPFPGNAAVLSESLDPRLTVEVDRFNLECNLRPCALAGRPFAALAGEMHSSLAEVRRAAATRGARIAVIGILPTLHPNDLGSSSMTDTARYRALSSGLLRLREGPFKLDIDGEEPLEITADDVTWEGANTSLQLHLKLPPDVFPDTYNAVQMATAPALAISGNSPVLVGHRLWHETRVALFKQSVDDRATRDGRRAARVAFGSGWLQESALDLFAESVRLHEPLVPVLGAEHPIALARAGAAPGLEELRLHQGTVWRWNRAIYDPVEGGHLRIELRALPAGPSVVDMVANSAFLIGLAFGLAPEVRRWCDGFPFAHAHENFYRAAQSGLDAELLWPPEPGAEPERRPAHALVPSLIPIALRGLERAGVDPAEAEPLLDIIDRRARSRQTGAAWQRDTIAALEPDVGRLGALAGMLERYLEHSEADVPVHEWPAARSR